MKRNILVLFMLIMGLCGVLNAQENKKPNIIYIMSDDHTSQAFGIYGSRLATLNPTPNLDKLANEGMIFDNCFVTNSICTPSRASIMTGQYSQQNVVLELNQPLTASKHYLPIEIKKQGYQTAIVGKWHLLEEPKFFDFYCVLPGQGNYFNPNFNVRGNNPWPENVISKKGHSTDVITDITLDWLKNKRDKSKPFFLMHQYKAPHDMFEFAPRYKDYLENHFIPEPASLFYNANNGSIGTRGIGNSQVNIIGASISQRDTLWGLGRRLGIDSSIQDPEYRHLVYQEYLKRYLRCVKGIDDNIGRLIKYLSEEGLLDNTIIIYTSDQGFMLGEHDYMDKRWMYDESMRMPFFIRYPTLIKPGSRTDAIINNTDFAPTLIELAGGETPSYMQGKSFQEILVSGEEPENWQKSTYYRYWMHMAHNLGTPAHFGIRTKEYKLIFYYGSYWIENEESFKKIFKKASWNKPWDKNFLIETPAAWELYNLKNDPEEMNNVYGHPIYKKIEQDLKSQLQAIRAALNEEDDQYPHIQKIIDEHWND
jgi:uncharacterized sulfatase